MSSAIHSPHSRIRCSGRYHCNLPWCEWVSEGVSVCACVFWKGKWNLVSNIKTLTVEVPSFPIAIQTNTYFGHLGPIGLYKLVLLLWGKKKKQLIHVGVQVEMSSKFFLFSFKELDDFLYRILILAHGLGHWACHSHSESKMITLLIWVQSQSAVSHQNRNIASKCNLAPQWHARGGSA